MVIKINYANKIYIKHKKQRCESAVEEAASVDGVGGVGASSWEAPKEISSSVLNELVATVRERPALVFIMRIYPILYK